LSVVNDSYFAHRKRTTHMKTESISRRALLSGFVAAALTLIVPVWAQDSLSPEERRAQWEAMTPEDRAAAKERRRAEVEAMSAEERQAFREQRKTEWESMTPEQREQARGRLQHQRREAFESMTPEERDSMRQRHRERLESMSPEQREQAKSRMGGRGAGHGRKDRPHDGNGAGTT
jgi:hypothetical protein